MLNREVNHTTSIEISQNPQKGLESTARPSTTGNITNTSSVRHYFDWGIYDKACKNSNDGKSNYG